MPAKWERVREVFQRAVELRRESRDDFLATACDGDAALRSEVERLLDEHEREGDLLETTRVEPSPESALIGRTIAHYRILEQVGQGGMGDVYKAEDLKLGRTVALKFLAPHLLREEAARARFVRETRAAAALDHPSICTLHSLEDHEGQAFMVMAYIDGPSLAELISKRPLPLPDALRIAIEIAEGLSEAHQHGIVHRDVKPGNVLLNEKGHVRILDFGLAAISDRTRLTKSGTVLGTTTYMSPEQAEGKAADHRTDIWSLGALLYEMLSGKRPFVGENDQAVLHSILTQEPEPLTALRTGLPMELELAVGKCLEKDPARRRQTMADVAVDLKAVLHRLQPDSKGSLPGASAASTQTAPTKRLLAMSTGVLAIALAGLGFVHFTEAQLERPVRRFSIAPEGLQGAAISPDGKHIAYEAERNGRRTLWLRTLAEESAREIPGTEGGRQAFWSPDSSSLGFGTFVDLKRVAIDGGEPITLCKLPSHPGGYFYLVGGTWSPTGEKIVFSAGHLLYEVSARGGQPKLLFEREKGPRFYRNPLFLPADDGLEALVYTSTTLDEDRRLDVLNLASGERRTLRPGFAAAYSSSGYLIHNVMGEGTGGLWGLPFSTQTLAVSGEPFRISQKGGFASVSKDGTLTYLEGATQADSTVLAWRDRAGRLIRTVGEPQPRIRDLSLSPDGRRAAVISSESGTREVWIHDLLRDAATRFTFGEEIEALPLWHPTGRRILYSFVVGQGARLRERAVGDGGVTRDLIDVDRRLANADWSGDGKFLVVAIGDSRGPARINYLEFDSNGQASELKPFLDTSASERVPRLSPDGRLVAYISDASGRDEVYVRSFPDGANVRQASSDGGTQPRWQSDGLELFYVEGATLKSVAVANQDELTLGRPQALFTSEDLYSGVATPQYEVASDGQAFLTITRFVEKGSPPAVVRIVENWQEEFRDQTPQ